MTEQQIEQALIEKLNELKYTYRLDISDCAALKTHNKGMMQQLIPAMDAKAEVEA